MNYSAFSGVAATALGIVYTVQAYHLPRATVGKPMAPILFPLGLGALITLFGIVLILESIKKGEFKRQEKADKGFSYTAKLIAYTCTVSIIYALLFDEIGFVFSTIFFLQSLLFMINGKSQWKTNTIVSVSFSVGVYIIFAKLLGITLPVMPFFYI